MKKDKLYKIIIKNKPKVLVQKSSFNEFKIKAKHRCILILYIFKLRLKTPFLYTTISNKSK